MSINDMSNWTFPLPKLEDWKQKSEDSLKGKSIETLSRDTFENIKLKPLYTRVDQNHQSQYPAQSDFRRGTDALGYVSQPFLVAQRITIEKNKNLKDTLSAVFAKGQSSISFEMNEDLLSQLSSLEDLSRDYPYSINGKDYHSSLINELSKLSNANEVSGYIAKDPIALLAEKGATQDTIKEEYDEFLQAINQADVALPQSRTVLIDTIPYHNGGANAVQELAIAISTGVAHIEQLLERGLPLKKILSKFVFQFAIGANFFMELAKIRAARILWSIVAESYGADKNDRGMVISAVTSSFTKTVFDPYVNMLRAGNEAFAAVLGGIQYLHVSPFNEPEGQANEFSNRVARNTQLILKEEAHLTNTVDPAGGSWYVEKLTMELAEKGWEYFLETENKGGMIEVLKEGWIQQEIAEVHAKRKEAIFTRKQTIVGTNKYANLQDTPLTVQLDAEKVLSNVGAFIIPIQQERLSMPYERLRIKAKSLQDHGTEVAVGLITLGNLKKHKARADFVTGFLSPGGIGTVLSGEVSTEEEALSFINETNLKHYCICGSDDQYAEIGSQFVEALKSKHPQVHLFLAGLQSKEESDEWSQKGIQQFIHVKSNCYETLSSLLDEMEVAENE